MKLIDDLQIQILSYYDNIIVLLPKLAVALVVSALMYIVFSTLRKRITNYLRGRADDVLLINFANSIFKIILFMVIALTFLSIIGQGGIATKILGAAGVSAFVIGFALKDIGENFLAGVIMAFDRPFRLGDTVKTGEVEGVITEMSLRDTHIKTFDGKDVYVPNGQFIKNPLYNYTIDGYLRMGFTIGLDYGTDIDKARTIMQQSIDQIPGILKDDKPPMTLIKEFAASTINIEVQYWINTFDTNYSSIEIKSQVMKRVLNDLEANNINLPGDVIEIKNYRDQPVVTKANTSDSLPSPTA